MKISQAIEFLSDVQGRNGDLDLESITGFWVRRTPSTGERVVVPSVGDGKSVKDLVERYFHAR